MLFDSFCLELEKTANPNILKYIDTYKPAAALSALYKEFTILDSHLRKPDLDPELKKAIQRRIDTLNKTEFLIKTYEKSVKRFGRKRSPDQHLRIGLQDDLHESTRTERRVLDQMVMTGKLSKQNAAIALKNKARKRIPGQLNKEFVESLPQQLGVVKGNEQAMKDKALIQSKVMPVYPDAAPEKLDPLHFAKQANVRMRSVTGSKGRNKSGLAISKKIMPIKSVSAPIVTGKLRKSMISANKKALGSLADVGMSDPKYLGKIASQKLPGMKLLATSSKRKVSKPKKDENLLKKVRFAFRRPKLIKPPKTKLTKYLQKKGFK